MTKEKIREKWLKHTFELCLNECIDNAMEEYAQLKLSEKAPPPHLR
jgi:hypothetical protein